jgi:hypothetical protein
VRRPKKTDLEAFDVAEGRRDGERAPFTPETQETVFAYDAALDRVVPFRSMADISECRNAD